MNSILPLLSCPVCGGALTREGGSLVCTGNGKRHTYDVAKSGYVNLLPPGRGRNAKSGDDTEMVRSRRAFLEKGYYDPLSAETARLAAAYCPSPEGNLVIADAGCGEGYHTLNIASKAHEVSSRTVVCCGFDASKLAADRASKLAVTRGMAPRGGVGSPFEGKVLCAFMTGNIFSLPLKDSSAGAVVSMFAPIAWEENRRVLTPGGALIVAASGRDHLSEMRSIIYDEVRYKEDDSAPAAGDGFSLEEHTRVTYSILLTEGEDIMNLFGMTPFSYRAPAEGVKRLSETESLEVTVDTDFYVFRLNEK